MDEPLDIRYGSIGHRSGSLAARQHPGAMLLRMLITSMKDAGNVAVVFLGILADGPVRGIVHWHSIGIEQIAHPHQELVASALLEHDTLFRQLRLGSPYRFL